MTPHDKQVMMFSATLSKEIRPVCKKFMQDVMSHGQFYLNFSTFFHKCQLSAVKNAVVAALYAFHLY